MYGFHVRSISPRTDSCSRLPISMPADTAHARPAILIRCLGVSVGVIARNAGTAAIGAGVVTSRKRS